jgi:hypothetical protein
MKGSITITDTIGILAIVIILVVFISKILPSFLSILVDNFSKASAESVARQLSNLITISGAATYKIEIKYTPPKDVDYDVLIDSRTVKVTPKFKVSYAEKSSSTQPFAVNLPNQEYKGVNSFLVREELVNGGFKYGLLASKS